MSISPDDVARAHADPYTVISGYSSPRRRISLGSHYGELGAIASAMHLNTDLPPKGLEAQGVLKSVQDAIASIQSQLDPPNPDLASSPTTSATAQNARNSISTLQRAADQPIGQVVRCKIASRQKA